MFLEANKETSVKILSPKATKSESRDVSLPANGSLPNEGLSQVSGQAKRKESLKEAVLNYRYSSQGELELLVKWDRLLECEYSLERYEKY